MAAVSAVGLVIFNTSLASSGILLLIKPFKLLHVDASQVNTIRRNEFKTAFAQRLSLLNLLVHAAAAQQKS